MDKYAAKIDDRILFFVYADSVDEAYNKVEAKIDRILQEGGNNYRPLWRNYGLVESVSSVEYHP